MRVRSEITRPFDLSLASNRFVLIATPLSGVAAGLVTLAVGDGWALAVRHGFSAGGATFLAWALVRELHPDRLGVAVVAAALAPFGLFLGTPDLLATTVVLLAARLVAGTTGRGLRWADLVIVTAFATSVAMRSTGAGVLTTTAIALFGVLLVQDRHRLDMAIATLIVAGLAVYAWWDIAVAFDRWTIVPAVLGAFALLGPRRVTSATDRPGGVISPHRIRAARGYTLTAAALAALFSDPSAMAPVWIALAATAMRPT